MTGFMIGILASSAAMQAAPAWTFDQAVDCSVTTAIMMATSSGSDQLSYQNANTFWSSAIFEAGTSAGMSAETVGPLVEQTYQARGAQYSTDPASVQAIADACVAQAG